MLASDDLDSLLAAALARAGEPCTVDAVRRALPAGKKPAKAEVQARLHALADSRRVQRWPGRTAKFSTVSPEAFVREHVLRALASGPLTEPEIKRGLPASAKPLLKPVLARLVTDGAIVEHPKLARRVRYGLGPADASDYLPAELDALMKRMHKLGFSAEQVETALRHRLQAPGASGEAGGVATEMAGDPEQALLAAMVRLNSQASRGALVYLTALRGALAERFRDKDAFDRAVLDLANRGKVQLQSHPWPGRLSEADKRALVPNGRGGFFDAIGLRLE